VTGVGSTRLAALPSTAPEDLGPRRRLQKCRLRAFSALLGPLLCGSGHAQEWRAYTGIGVEVGVQQHPDDPGQQQHLVVGRGWPPPGGTRRDGSEPWRWCLPGACRTAPPARRRRRPGARPQRPAGPGSGARRSTGPGPGSTPPGPAGQDGVREGLRPSHDAPVSGAPRDRFRFACRHQVGASRQATGSSGLLAAGRPAGWAGTGCGCPGNTSSSEVCHTG